MAPGRQGDAPGRRGGQRGGAPGRRGDAPRSAGRTTPWDEVGPVPLASGEQVSVVSPQRQALGEWMAGGTLQRGGDEVG